MTSSPAHPCAVRVFVASRNRAKVAELERILRVYLPSIEVCGIADVPAYDEPVEDQATFAGNALSKARAGYEATGLPAIADDSGLCVDALGGMPGVLSARWAGRAKDDAANNALLLDQLADVPNERRDAHFVCAVAFVAAQGAERVVEGRWEGAIVRQQQGSGGFGYDVVFAPREHPDRTSAELSPDEKDAMSHRGRALRALAPLVAADLGTTDRKLGSGEGGS